VVAAGGDGAAAEIVNRMPPATPLALLPTGTEICWQNICEAQPIRWGWPKRSPMD